MMRKLYNLIKAAYVTLTDDDATSYPTAQAGYKGKVASFIRLSPYGIDSNPPTGSFVLLFSAYGQESNKFGISSDMINRRQSLKEGEVAIYNTMTGSVVLLKENGGIDVDAKGDLSITVSGDATVKAASVNIDASDAPSGAVNWGTHVHPDPQGGKTGPPEDPV